MQSFTIHTGVVATLDRANVDTDQIIPKQFLKRIRKHPNQIYARDTTTAPFLSGEQGHEIDWFPLRSG
jgi:3-isopropylmalate dehydratase small subunit